MSIRQKICFFLVVGLCNLLINPGIAQAKVLVDADAISSFYEERQGEPLWFKGRSLNQKGRDLLFLIENSWQNGLKPKAYHLETIKGIYAGNDFSKDLDENRMLEVELLLTDAYIRHFRDLSGMRIRALDMDLNPEHWRQPVSIRDALETLKDDVNIIRLFKSIEPQTKTYQALKSELIRLVEERSYVGASPQKIFFETVALPGRGYNNIPRLRQRMGLKDVPEEKKYMYDPDLVEAVKKFQLKEGLVPDGVIGKMTLSAMNRGAQDKINQIIVNMERLRWVHDKKPERFIIVNIPSAMLWAIDKGAVRFQMPVIVGREERQTNIFVTSIHGVRFHPDWTVPPTIKKEDIVPHLQENPNYLADKGMELFNGYGAEALTIDPSIIDWNSISEAELEALKLVQIPGAHNPLGMIRILMPNRYNIYLHDTNEKSLFNASSRALSSGCIRMKDPEKVAMFVLEKKGGWDQRQFNVVMSEDKTRDIYTDENMPVYIMYYTVWLGDNDRVNYGIDVYGRDKKLLQLLEKLDEL